MSIGTIKHVAVEHELKEAYLDYAMSVIVGRALPDVRDGLKPVHRRVLYAMQELSNYYNKPYKKSARIVGDVIGKYHPHGDTAVYDSIVRMAQDFSMRYVLIDGQGNFGSIDGDAAAAMRYTEIRMAKLAHELLQDLEKQTVDFVPNYDNSESAPSVLPAKFPNLLVNGTSGIAVGMATNIPPHNLSEILDATILLLDDPEVSLDALLEVVQGPDFPTGALVSGASGMREAYRTGRGKVKIRGVAEVEEDSSGKQSIVITEIPYQVNKARLIEKVSQLVKEKRVEGITAIRDESDKKGMRVVIEVRRGEYAEVLLNKLYALTQLQVSFGYNMVALDNNLPRCMGLKDILMAFITHRKEVVIRRTRFELAKARDRAHLLEGLAVALVNIDEVVQLIKSAKSPQEAKEGLLAKSWDIGHVSDLFHEDRHLCRPHNLPEQYGYRDGKYYMSVEQAQAILDMRLHRLTGLERDKIVNEYKALIVEIIDLLDILANDHRLIEVIKGELRDLKEQFGDARKTRIVQTDDLSEEDLIANEKMVITLSHLGYVKSQPLEVYQAQHRGGKGKSSTQVKDEDYIHILKVVEAHDTLLMFTTRGRVFWKKAYQMPVASRTAKGRPIVNYLPLEKDESLTAILPIQALDQDAAQLVMVTSQGRIKKVALKHFSRPRNSGVIAIDLVPEDRLIGVELTDGNQEIMLFSDAGKVIRFHESLVRSMGRTARGVRGIALKEGQACISLIVIKTQDPILTATENGYGKQTDLSEYRVTARGGQGVISIQVSERNGKVIGALQAPESSGIILLGTQGTLVHIPVDEVSKVGRNTAGVRLIKLPKDEKLCDLQLVASVDEDVVEEATDAI